MISIGLFCALVCLFGYSGYKQTQKQFGETIAKKLRFRLFLAFLFLTTISACSIIAVVAIPSLVSGTTDIRFDEGDVVLWISLIIAFFAAGVLVFTSRSRRNLGQPILIINVPTLNFDHFLPIAVVFGSLVIVFSGVLEGMEKIMLAAGIMIFMIGVVIAYQSSIPFLVTTNGLCLNGLLLKWDRYISYRWNEPVDSYVILEVISKSRFSFLGSGYLRIPLSQRDQLDILLRKYILKAEGAG